MEQRIKYETCDFLALGGDDDEGREGKHNGLEIVALVLARADDILLYRLARIERDAFNLR